MAQRRDTAWLRRELAVAATCCAVTISAAGIPSAWAQSTQPRASDPAAGSQTQEQSAQSTEARKQDSQAKSGKAAKTQAKSSPKNSTPQAPGLSAADAAQLAALEASPARFDKTLGPRIWDIPFPSYGDTILQDAGGWRSKLAEYGIGLIAWNVSIFQSNLLNGPSVIPNYAYAPSAGAFLPYPKCGRNPSAICAGGQAYLGQQPFGTTDSYATLTYDMNQWGIPDAQIVVGGMFILSSNDAFLKDGWTTVTNLIWNQSFYNKTFEVKLGLMPLNQEFVGVFVGGNFANSFGPSASIPAELGLGMPNGVPAAMVKWNITDKFYNQFAVGRSQPVNGPTGNPFYDEAYLNPNGFRMVPTGTSALIIDEVGYKAKATPTELSTWVRAGGIWNFSDFKDLRNLTSAETVGGSGGVYFLVDQQIWQQAPGSIFTAHRGIYAGFSAMYAPPEVAAFSQYYEGRLYWIGPFDNRPTDMISFVYAHNEVSKYLADGINQITKDYQPFTDYILPFANYSTNSYTLTYLAHLMPGLYASVGVSYTDNPSIQTFQGQGSALSFLGSITTVF